MKLKLPLFMFSSILLSTILICADSPKEIRKEVFSFSTQEIHCGVFRAIETDFTDLEARDINNQSVKNALKKNALNALFADNLLTLLLTTEIQSLTVSLNSIRYNLKLGAFYIGGNVPVLIAKIIDVLLQGTKKILVKLLVCVSSLLTVSVSAISAFCFLQIALTKTLTPVNFRC